MESYYTSFYKLIFQINFPKVFELRRSFLDSKQRNNEDFDFIETLQNSIIDFLLNQNQYINRGFMLCHKTGYENHADTRKSESLLNFWKVGPFPISFGALEKLSKSFFNSKQGNIEDFDFVKALNF